MIVSKILIALFILFNFFALLPKVIAAAPSWNKAPYLNEDNNRILFDLSKGNGEELIVVLYVDGKPVDEIGCVAGTTRCQTNDSKGGALSIPTTFISPTATVKVCNGTGSHDAKRFNCDGKTILLEATVDISTAHGGGGSGGAGSGQNPCSISPSGECPTALGNIPTNPKAFAEKILQIGTGLAGGIAFILMVIGSIRVLTSSGDQQKLSAGRDMIVAAVAGLLFIIFSVLILRFIGVEIIKIPGMY